MDNLRDGIKSTAAKIAHLEAELVLANAEFDVLLVAARRQKSGEKVRTATKETKAAKKAWATRRKNAAKMRPSDRRALESKQLSPKSFNALVKKEILTVLRKTNTPLSKGDVRDKVKRGWNPLRQAFAELRAEGKIHNSVKTAQGGHGWLAAT